MKINKIEMYNIGSYKGKNTISFKTSRDKNIVLIGGKNGAGKTTLFDSIRLCLYGYRTFGYELFSTAYKQQIERLVSDSVKLSKSEIEAWIKLDIDLEDGQTLSNYILKRKWILKSNSFETFSVQKNSTILSSDEIEDFNNYLLSIIPPELFNLYFFDGEQIAEYFLSDGSGDRLKAAFLILCGYDNLAIMLQNFQRHVRQKKTNDTATKYLEAKINYQNLVEKISKVQQRISASSQIVSDCKAELKSIEKDYSKRGGVSIKEWNDKFEETKLHEKKREGLNTEIKKLAIEEIPYVILRERIKELYNQLLKEDQVFLDKNTINYLNLIMPEAIKNVIRKKNSRLSKNEIKLFSDKLITELQLLGKGKHDDLILNLSQADRDNLLVQIRYALKVEEAKVINNRQELKASIERSKELRNEIESCSIDYINTYNKNRTRLEETIKNQQEYINYQTTLIESKANELKETKELFDKNASKLEEEIKKNSVIDISARASLLIENLLNSLVESKLSLVENAFEFELNRIKQKDEFISRIHIDSDFNIHAYKKMKIHLNDFTENPTLLANTEFVEIIDSIMKDNSLSTEKEFLQFCETNNSSKIYETEIEIDKTRFSKGEKQIFIMALYWALMMIAKIRVPFMIDTPFARIDSKHREKISDFFFKELPGQVLIFSTDEEIIGRTFNIISDKIGSSLLLVNSDNNQTIIIPDTYF